MRYWKGAYDEDSFRDRELRLARGLSAGETDPEIHVFHALVAVQVGMAVMAVVFTVAELLRSWQ